MELSELYKKTLDLFECDSAEDLGTHLLTACSNPDKLIAFSDLVDNEIKKVYVRGNA